MLPRLSTAMFPSTQHWALRGLVPTQGSMGRGRLARRGCAAPVPTSLDADSGRPIRLDWLTLSSSAPFAVTLFPNTFPAGELPFTALSYHCPSRLRPRYQPPGSGPLQCRILSIFGSCPQLGLGPVVLRHPGVSDSLAHLASPSCPYRASSSHVLRRPPATANFLPSA